jgi:hypothetical protein
VLARAAELGTLAVWMDGRTDRPSLPTARQAGADTDAAIRGHLATACDAARGVSFWRAARGARMERAFAHVDAAEAALLLRAPDSYVVGQLPSIMTHVRAHLAPSNPQRRYAERLAEDLLPGTAPVLGVLTDGATPGGRTASRATTARGMTSGATASGLGVHGARTGSVTAGNPTAGNSTARVAGSRNATPAVLVPVAEVSDEDRVSLVNAVQSASAAARREHARLRSFRNIVIMTTVAMLVLAVALALLGWQRKAWIPLCFAPQGLESVVCPTTTAALPDDAETGVPASAAATAAKIATTARGHDIALVMLVGLAAAAVTGAAALRNIRGTSTPFAVPVALVALKLPTGALTALLGLLLINGGFVPGLSALDSSGQILAWALVFGAAQQLVTRLVDRRAQTVLDSVGSTPMTTEKE